MSTHIAINLIPRSRRAVRHKRARIRGWAVFNVLWLIGVGVVTAMVVISARAGVNSAGAAVVSEGISPEAAEEQLRAAKERLAEAQRRDQSAMKEATRAKLALDTARRASDRPDWSLLLTLIESERGADVMLESVEISGGMQPDDAGGGAGPGAAPRAAAPSGSAPKKKIERYDIKISGLAESPAAASALVLRLERLGLFSKIQLAETRPREIEGMTKTAFRLEAELRQLVASAAAAEPPRAGTTGAAGGSQTDAQGRSPFASPASSRTGGTGERRTEVRGTGGNP